MPPGTLSDGHAAALSRIGLERRKAAGRLSTLVVGAMLASMSERHDLDVPALARVCMGKADIRLLVIFGSVATGKARPDSDVDVGILGGAFHEQQGLGAEIGGQLGREAHVVDLAAASDWLRFQVARDGVVISQAEPDAWVLFKARAMLDYWDLAPVISLCAAGVRARLEREARHG